MFRSISLITGALLIKKEQILLIKRVDKLFENKYSIPGGHIELGETPKKALKREIKEELSLKIKEVKFLNYQNLLIKGKHIISLNFTVKPINRKMKINKTEIKETKWFPLKTNNEITHSVNSLIKIVQR